MTLDPSEANPMLSPASGVAARIAATGVEVRALIEGAAGLEVMPTFDAQLVLLADDHDLAERLRAFGLHLPRPAGTYAERQWDARESVEVSAHRIFDHA